MASDAGYWPQVQQAFDDASIYAAPEEWLTGLARHPRNTGLLLAVHWLAAEVDNGGLIQFFDNSTGVVAPEAVEGLAAIGMPESAAEVSAAMARLPHPYPRDQSQRLAHRAAFTHGVLVAVDNRLYELFDSENGGITAAMDRFAERMP
ncbi:MAG: DUF4375 domain-containing protein [Phycisphaerales bacterium]|nr:DUF4375 domain-containing protein [Phycisphaerales bacterium]